MHKQALIIGPSWVGDMIMAQSLFITLKQQKPDLAIDVLAPAWTSPLLERMPEVREALSLDIGHGQLLWKERKRIGRELSKTKYDVCYVLPNSLKSALIPFFAKIPKRIGWLKEPRYILLNDLRKLDKQAYPLMVQRFNALAWQKGEVLSSEQPRPLLKVNPESAAKAMQTYQLNKENGSVLVLCPGAEFGPAKRWPDKHYSAVAIEHLSKGGQVWLFGSAKDREVCQLIDDVTNGRCNNLAGKTSLAEAIDLMSLADMVVSNDSGLMHMAAAVGCKLVVVYGSSSPLFTPPLSNSVKIVSQGLDCSPCFKRECPLGHLDCLNNLSPEKVLIAMTELNTSLKSETKNGGEI